MAIHGSPLCLLFLARICWLQGLPPKRQAAGGILEVGFCSKLVQGSQYRTDQRHVGDSRRRADASHGDQETPLPFAGRSVLRVEKTGRDEAADPLSPAVRMKGLSAWQQAEQFPLDHMSVAVSSSVQLNSGEWPSFSVRTRARKPRAPCPENSCLLCQIGNPSTK
jgi:hypothetical protein